MLSLRMLSQQLAAPRFGEPAQVVRWMGALQGQDFRSAKWAVGMRTTDPALSAVDKALDTGEILRLHILRTTWHIVPGRNMGWMAELNRSRLVSGFTSWAKANGLSQEDFMPLYSPIVDSLSGTSLTKQELLAALSARGIVCDERRLMLCISAGEADGRICSGPRKDGKHTYALYEDRVTDPVRLTREEALNELARRYFRSHGPATLDDFVWWSGLGMAEARSAVYSLGQEAVRESYGGRELFYVPTAGTGGTDCGKILHLLPPFDEYLISYKERGDCIRDEHKPFAYNSFGIFQPVILHNGRITGNWRKTGRKTGEPVTTTFFDGCRPAAKPLIVKAWKRYAAFLEH